MPQISRTLPSVHSDVVASPAQTGTRGTDTTASAAVQREHGFADAGQSQRMQLQRRHSLARHDFGDAGKDLMADPGLAQIRASRDHLAVDVSAENRAEVRRAIQQMLSQMLEPNLYLGSEMVSELLSGKATVSNNQVQPAPDDWERLLESGGTLILDNAGFAPERIELYNEVMQGQTYAGKPLAHHLRVILLNNIDESSRQLTYAQLSRTVPLDLTGFSAPGYRDPALTVVQRRVPGEHVVALEWSPFWRDQTDPQPDNGPQGWHIRAGQLDSCMPGQRVVLSCAPEDEYLADRVLMLRARGIDAVLEPALPSELRSQALLRRGWIDEPEQVIAAAGNAVVCLNAGNIGTVLDHVDLIDRDGQPRRAPSLLERSARLTDAGQAGVVQPIVLVTGFIDNGNWHRLMMHPAKFDVVCSNQVKIPDEYADYVSPLNYVRPEQHGQMASHDAPVTFILASDPDLIAQESLADPMAVRINISPHTRAEQLLLEISMLNDPEQRPTARVSANQLLHDLCDARQGPKRPVYLFGLESNPEVADALASLLYPPHNLLANGRSMSYQAGQLCHPLKVVSSDATFIGHYSLTPLQNRIVRNADWRWQQVAETVTRDAPSQVAQNILQERITSLHGLMKVCVESNVVREQDSVPTAARLRMLVQQLFSRSKPSTGLAQAAWRSLYEDMLIGTWRYAGGVPDYARYDKLRLELRLHFPDVFETLPPTSVDIAALRKVAASLSHPQQADNNPWRILDCFSVDVIASVVPDRRESKAALANRVLRLFLDQCRAFNITVAPLIFRQYPSLKIRLNLPPLQPVSVAQPDMLALNDARLGLLLENSPATYFEGPPATGKSYSMNRDQRGPVFRVSTAQISEPESMQKVAQWACTPGAELYFDEANLAEQGALQFMESWLHDGTLLIDGKRVRVPSNNRIKAAGNDGTMGGRTHQNFLDSLPVLRFQPHDSDSLRKVFLQPLLKEALAGQSDELASLLPFGAKALLDLHQSFTAAWPVRQFSPRHLEECAGQLFALARSLPANMRNDATIKTFLMRIVLDVYGSVMDPSERETMQFWIAAQAGLAFEDVPEWPPFDLNGSGLAATPSLQHACNQLYWRLRIAPQYRALSQGSGTIGQPLVILRGAPATAKDEAVKAVLQHMGITDFVHITVDLKRIDELEQAVADAAARDVPVVFSEINLLPGPVLESLLNNAVTGLETDRAARNFCVIGTENHDGMSGRTAHSEAIASRTYLINVAPSGPDDIEAIVAVRQQAIATAAGNAGKGAGHALQLALLNQLQGVTELDPVIAKEIVFRHARLMRILKNGGQPILPTPRQINMLLERIMLQRQPLESAFDAVYGHFIKHARQILATTPAQRHIADDEIDFDAFINFQEDEPVDALFGDDVPPALLADEPIMQNNDVGQQDRLLQKRIEHILRLIRKNGEGLPNVAPMPEGLCATSPAHILYDTEDHQILVRPQQADNWRAICSDLIHLTQQGFPFTDPQTGLPRNNTEAAEALQHSLQEANTADVSGKLQAFNGNGAATFKNRKVQIGRMPGNTGNIMLVSEIITEGEATLHFLNTGQYGNHMTLTAAPAAQRILLDYAPIIELNGNPVIKLSFLWGQRPVNVSIGGWAPHTLIMSADGQWLAPVNPAQVKEGEVSDIRYQLIEHEPGLFQRGQPAQPVQLTLGDPFADDVLALRQNNPGLTDAVHQLETIFQKHFVYDMNYTPPVGHNYAQALVNEGKGVCRHFADLAANLLETYFGFPSLVLNGISFDGEKIMTGYHAQAVAQDAAGNSVIADFEIDSINKAGRGTYEEHALFPVHLSKPDREIAETGYNATEDFDPEKLNLSNVRASLKGVVYNNCNRGKFSVSQFVKRASKLYAEAGTKNEQKIRSIYFAGFPAQPPHGNSLETWLLALLPAINALMTANNPIEIYGSHSANGGARTFKKLDDATQVQTLLTPDPHEISRVTNNPDCLVLQDDEASAKFLENLLSYYLENLLDIEEPIDNPNVILGNSELMNKLADIFFFDPLMYEELPMTVKIGGCAVRLEANGLLQAMVDVISTCYQDLPVDELIALLEPYETSLHLRQIAQDDPVINRIAALFSSGLIEQLNSADLHRIHLAVSDYMDVADDSTATNWLAPSFDRLGYDWRNTTKSDLMQ